MKSWREWLLGSLISLIRRPVFERWFKIRFPVPRSFYSTACCLLCWRVCVLRIIGIQPKLTCSCVIWPVLSYIEGHKARSLIEYSLFKKWVNWKLPLILATRWMLIMHAAYDTIRYFLFLLVNVVFIFLLASTYWQLVRDLANSPAKVPEKLAQALRKGQAKSFFVSYVVLQGEWIIFFLLLVVHWAISLGLGVMPLQLLNLGTIVPRMISRMFFTRTPRGQSQLS